MSKKVMRLLNRSTGLMECKVCGKCHFAMLQSGGRYVRGSWQCQNHCRLDEAEPTIRPIVTIKPQPPEPPKRFTLRVV